MDYNELGKLVREIRKRKGLRQHEFAELCELGSAQKVSNIETGLVPIGINLFRKICMTCKVKYKVKIYFP